MFGVNTSCAMRSRCDWWLHITTWGLLKSTPSATALLNFVPGMPWCIVTKRAAWYISLCRFLRLRSVIFPTFIYSHTVGVITTMEKKRKKRREYSVRTYLARKRNRRHGRP